MFIWGCNPFIPTHNKTLSLTKTPTQIPFFNATTIKQLSCGNDHAICLTLQNSSREPAFELYGIGSDRYGQSLSASEREPTSISEYFTKIKLISCGAMHSVVVTEDEKLWVFGCNSFGQISDDLNIRALGPTCISHDVLKGKKIVNVSCGWSFTVVLTEDGDLFMNGVFDGFLVSQPKWFSNLIPNEHIVHVACGNDFLIALNKKQQVFGIGENDVYQLGLGHNKSVDKPVQIQSLCNKDIYKVTCGAHHTIALTRSGLCYGWGWNRKGNLGVGHLENITVPTLLIVPSRTIQVSAGKQHTMFMTIDGLYCCGSNDYHQLGIGSKYTSQFVAKYPMRVKLPQFCNQVQCGLYYSIAYFSPLAERDFITQRMDYFQRNLERLSFIDTIFDFISTDELCAKLDTLKI